MDLRDELIREKLDTEKDRIKRDRFLSIIEQLESSGNKNTAHQTMQSGIHAGDTAIGRYGLMPKTVQELAAREKGRMPSEMNAVEDLTPIQESRIAEQLAERVLARFPEEEMAAYAWNQGHNLTPERIQERDYQSHPYVQKFRRIREKLGY